MFDRYLLFVIPILLILLPLLSRSPLLYQAYMSRKVNRWYKDIHRIDQRVDSMGLQEVGAASAELVQIDARLMHELSLPNSYMPGLYDLRTHIDYVNRRLQERRTALPTVEAMPQAS